MAGGGRDPGVGASAQTHRYDRRDDATSSEGLAESIRIWAEGAVTLASSPRPWPCWMLDARTRRRVSSGWSGGQPEIAMRRRPTQPDRDRAQSWKGKMGVEFSGLERPRDFLFAFAFLMLFVAVAAVIAFIAFG